MSVRPQTVVRNLSPASGRTLTRWARLARSVGIVTAGLVTAGGLALAAPASAAPATTSGVTTAAARAVLNPGDEGQFVTLLNRRRVANGARPLVVRADLTAVARGWSASMASRDVLSHNPQLGGQVHNWRIVGENVGVGYSVDSLDVAFWNSAGHRANLLDKQYTELGVGVTTVGTKIFVTLDFRAPWPVTAAPAPDARQQAARDKAARDKVAKVKAAKVKAAKVKAAKVKAAKVKAAKAKAAKAKAAKAKAKKGKSHSKKSKSKKVKKSHAKKHHTKKSHKKAKRRS